MKFAILKLNLWLEHQVLSSFFFNKVTKAWRKGKPPPLLEFHEYFDDKTLCVVACIDEYLRRSAAWRTHVQNQLPINHLKPYKEIQNSIITTWVKLVLKMAGIDTCFTRLILVDQPQLLKPKYCVCLLKTYWKEVSGRGHRLGKDIIIR